MQTKSTLQGTSVKSHAGSIAVASYVQKNAFSLTNKRWYPSFHLAPYAGWLGVPCGLCYHNGLYHAFYQHNPFSGECETMHWGHSTSKDLEFWQHQPVALAPGDEFDRDGCFSGTGVSHDGKLYLFYTGHVWLGDGADGDGAEGERQMYQQQCLAVSEDGIHFEKKGPLIKPPPGYIHIRDPMVWRDETAWYMLCAGRQECRGVAELILFKSTAIDDWSAAKQTVLLSSEDKNAFMWECPDFFAHRRHAVVLFSQQSQSSDAYERRNRFQSGYQTGRWHTRSRALSPTCAFREIDRGHDFYAPQTFATADGRHILIAWMDMWGSPMPTKGDGWSGALTIPRELSIPKNGGQAIMRPVEELVHLRGARRSVPRQDIPSNTELVLVKSCTAHELEVTLNLQTSTAEKYGIWLGSGAEFYVDTQSHRLVLNRHYPEFMISGYRSCAIPDCTFLKLRIFIDRSSMEVFVNDGAETFSSRVYPAAGDRALRLFAINGVADVCSGDVWPMDECMLP